LYELEMIDRDAVGIHFFGSLEALSDSY